MELGGRVLRLESRERGRGKVQWYTDEGTFYLDLIPRCLVATKHIACAFLLHFAFQNSHLAISFPENFDRISRDSGDHPPSISTTKANFIGW
jgi:hypothetical protein